MTATADTAAIAAIPLDPGNATCVKAPRAVRGAISGAALMMGTKVLSLLVSLLATAIIARLVTPADYGLVMMVTSVTAFLTLPSDFGLSLVTVQKPRISQEQLSTLFWINVAFGLLLGVIALGMAPMLVRLYHDPRVLGITLVNALVFPIAALGVQHEALVKRHMQFGRLSLVRLFSNIVALSVTVLLAWRGWGYWALATQNLIMTLLSTIGVWLCIHWLPGVPRRCAELREMLHFGGSLTAHGIVGYFPSCLDKVLLGWYSGAHPLGLYSNAYTLMSKVLTVTGQVSEAAIPAMSRAAGQVEQMRNVYRRMLQFSVVIGLPICLISIVWANEVVRTLLGPRWQEAQPLLQWLFVAALPRMLMSSTGWVYIATGRPDRMLRWQLMWSPAVVLAFLAGLPWAAKGVAEAYAIACWIGLVPSLVYCFRGTPFTRRDVLQPVIRPLLCALVGWAGAGSVSWFFGDDTGREILGLVLHLVVFAVIYIIGAALTVPLVREALAKLRNRWRPQPPAFPIVRE